MQRSVLEAAKHISQVFMYAVQVSRQRRDFSSCPLVLLLACSCTGSQHFCSVADCRCAAKRACTSITCIVTMLLGSLSLEEVAGNAATLTGTVNVCQHNAVACLVLAAL